MGKIFTLPFEFKSKEYTLLIREKADNQSCLFNVSAITEDLNAKIYGNHTFRWDGESIVPVLEPIGKHSNSELQDRMAASLEQYLLLRENC
jgi:hypothetical protein